MRSPSISSDSSSEDALSLTIPVHLPSIKIISPTISPTGSQIKIEISTITKKNNIYNPKIEVRPSKQERLREIIKKAFRKKNLERIFPIIRWAPTYDLHKLLSDFIAGITVALTVLPQALAYATVAGISPIFGLYSSFVGPFVYIIFGSTKAITVGPAAIQSIMTYKYTQGKPPEYAVFLCFVTAVVTLSMGIFRMGFISNFISAPVISAFTSAVSLTIIATQLKPLLGLSFQAEEFLETLQGLSNHIDEIKKEDALLGLVCCVILILMKNLQLFFGCITKKSPRLDKALWLLSVAKSALVMLGSTLLVAHWYPNQPFSIVGHISPGLPSFKLPPLEIWNPKDNRTHSFTDILREEASALFVVPLLGVIGHCTIAKVFSGTERVDAGQEILVIGISNAIACCFSSMPIGGSFSRTTVNAQSGVQTPLGGLVTGVMVLLALQFLTPYFFYIPKASLASVICVSCIFMVNPYIILPLWRSKKMDLIPFCVTFLMTLFAGLEYGIAIGILISAVFLLFYSARPRVKVGTRQTPKGTVFIHILLDRSMCFPSVDYITNKIIKAARTWGSTDIPIVVDCHHIQFADYTAAEGMRDLILNINNMDYQVFFWKMKPSVFRVISGAIHSGVPFFTCNTEEELHAVIDGVHRRLSMFHPYVHHKKGALGPESNGRKNSDNSTNSTVATFTGVFV